MLCCVCEHHSTVTNSLFFVRFRFRFFFSLFLANRRQRSCSPSYWFGFLMSFECVRVSNNMSKQKISNVCFTRCLVICNNNNNNNSRRGCDNVAYTVHSTHSHKRMKINWKNVDNDMMLYVVRCMLCTKKFFFLVRHSRDDDYK